MAGIDLLGVHCVDTVYRQYALAALESLGVYNVNVVSIGFVHEANVLGLL
jgi:hypothetical protein